MIGRESSAIPTISESVSPGLSGYKCDYLEYCRATIYLQEDASNTATGYHFRDRKQFYMVSSNNPVRAHVHRTINEFTSVIQAIREEEE